MYLQPLPGEVCSSVKPLECWQENEGGGEKHNAQERQRNLLNMEMVPILVALIISGDDFNFWPIKLTIDCCPSHGSVVRHANVFHLNRRSTLKSASSVAEQTTSPMFACYVRPQVSSRGASEWHSHTEEPSIYCSNAALA